MCVPGVCTDAVCVADVGTEGVHTAVCAILHEEGGVCVCVCVFVLVRCIFLCLYDVVLYMWVWIQCLCVHLCVG